MRFWDTSAVVPLLVSEPSTATLRDLYRVDPSTCVWTLTEVEAASTLARLARMDALDAAGERAAAERLDHFIARARVVERVDAVKAQARRLLGIHGLKAADALQLGAAILYADHEPAGVEFVCLDQRLAEAAHREGFRILPQ